MLLVQWDRDAAVATTLDGAALALDPDSRDAWREAELLSDQVISVPTYRVGCEASASGDVKQYEAWRARARRFFDAMRMSRMVVVPMVKRASAFKGKIVDPRGRVTCCHYTPERGLWFS